MDLLVLIFFNFNEEIRDDFVHGDFVTVDFVFGSFCPDPAGGKNEKISGGAPYLFKIGKFSYFFFVIFPIFIF